MDSSSMVEPIRAAINPQVLTDVVRQDQRCPGFVLTSWQVDQLSDKGIANLEGLFRIRGMGYDPNTPQEERAWTVVLKNLKAPPEEGDITNIWYWKREYLAVQSGLLNDLPAGGIKPPRIYGTQEQVDGAWIWMELINEIDPPRWSVKRFPDTAYRLGRFNGEYLCGRSLPNFPWLSRDQGISWVPDAVPDQNWENPIVQAVVGIENVPRLKSLMAKRHLFFKAYRDLPQVFSHCDTSRRNHMFYRNSVGMEEMVSIDWAWCGIAPLGWDLSMLLPNSALLFEMEPGELPGVEQNAIPAYLEGLRSVGWQGDSQLLRLGYCVSASTFPIFSMATASLWWASEEAQHFARQQFGCSFEELAPGWRVINEHLLDLGEEALEMLPLP